MPFEIVRHAVIVVGARFGDHVDDAAGRAPELRIEALACTVNSWTESTGGSMTPRLMSGVVSGAPSMRISCEPERPPPT